MTLGILYREELKEYDFGIGHPFRGDRYQLFYQLLVKRLPEDNNYRILQADPATEQDLLLICEKDYIDFTREYYGNADIGSSSMNQFFKFHSMEICQSADRESWRKRQGSLSGRQRWHATWCKMANLTRWYL